jgi:hypothetical protein
VNFFEHIRNILYGKKPLKLTISDGFSPYVAQRYLSFNFDDDQILRLNDLVNCNPALHKDPQNFYDFCMKVFPKVAIYRPNYIKSERNEKIKKIDGLESCAKFLNITKKHLTEYLTIDPTILVNFNKAEELYKLKK